VADEGRNERDWQRLEQRVDYLEEINRWHLFGLDLLLSLREVHDTVREGRNPAVILNSTRDYLNRLLNWRAIAFFTVNEVNSEFLLYDLSPESEREWIEKEVEGLIDNGEFAWALNQNRQVVYPARDRDCSLVLHVLTTKSRLRGMFVGVPAVPVDSIPDGSLQILSVILHHTAYVLESAELYHLLHDENRLLEEKIAEHTEQMRYQVTHDVLTGLPNRVLFADRLGQAIRHTAYSSLRCGVLMVDVDSFMLVNDSLGRASGDDFLRQFGQRLHHQLTDGRGLGQLPALDEATVARVGVDEFLILLPQLQRVEEVADTIELIHQITSHPFSIEGQIVYITVSIGASLCPDDSDSAETLLAQADVAMHHAKANGKGSSQFYTPRMNERALDRLTMANRLREALDERQFVLYYQPQIDLGSGRVSGVEALIRWRRSDGVLVPPMEFIPLLEDDQSLIIPTGRWVMDEAARLLKRVISLGHAPFKVAVNLSATQFMDPGLAEHVAHVLSSHLISAGDFELELTESTIMRDVPRAVSTLNQLNELGVKLAIDDFGTGYSSLAYLKRFPLDLLKIDRSFVRDVQRDQEDAAIVRAVVAMAHTLGLHVVAEGVETREQLDFLSRLGARYIQGFLYSRPLPEEELIEFLAGWDGAAGESG
jgi:diguanylate cyclase (GGDEF)-like protein